MPIYDYQCECGYRSDRFVWHLDDEVFCPLCHRRMKRLFTTTCAELKSTRSKPRPYYFDPSEGGGLKSVWESAKADYERGQATDKEIKFWKKKLEQQYPNLVI